MVKRQTAPFGSWKSPISSDLIVGESVGLGQLALDGSDIYWVETRPSEEGRQVLVKRTPDGQFHDLTPRPFSVRTRVHEYGGGAFIVADGVVYFSNFLDQRLYCQRPGMPPEPITPAAINGEGEYRYADEVVDQRRNRIICVREDHSPAHSGSTLGPVNTLVGIDCGGQREDHQRHGLPGPPAGEGGRSNRSTLLLEHHLKELRLPTFLREYRKLAAQCAAENVDHPDYLLRLSELELIDRHQRMVQRRIRAARFPAVKSLDTFDFLAIPSVNKQLVMELAQCEYIEHRENVIAVGNSGTGQTHVALGLGLAACQKGMSVGFTTAAALVHELMEARDDRRLLNLQRQLARLRLLIIDELGFVPLSTTGAELLFEVFSQRYERGSVLVTTNLPFDEWTDVFGSERLTGALLDRLTHHVHILEMNGDSYRLKHSRQNAASQVSDDPVD